MSGRKSSKGDPVVVSMSKLQGKDNPTYIHDEVNPSIYDSIESVGKANEDPNGISIISRHTPSPNLTRRRPNGDVNGSALPNDCMEIVSPSTLESDTLAPKKNGSVYGTITGGQGTDGNGPTPPAVQTQNSTVQMKRSINLLYMTAIMVAVTGHSSIFVSPSSILVQTGSVGGALIVWLIGGLINLGMALCFAEMGTMFAQAGGPYAYASKAFGPLMGFLMMWGYTVLIAGPFWAFLAYTAALYIVRPIFSDCHTDDIDTAVNLLAGWIMVTMVVLNCVYMKYVTKVQTLLSASKILALLIIIGAGIYNLAIGETENLENPFEGTTEEPGKFALAIFYSVFSYGGWQVMTTMLEEVKNPSRDPPRSVYISFAIVITKYVLTNVAYFTLLTPQEIMGSSAVASLFIERLYSPLTILISVFVALTSIGALNASIMGHSRLLYAGARNGHMPQILGMVSTKYLTPWPSIFVYLAWGMVMLFTGGVVDMMEFISLFSTIMGIVVISALLYLRWKQPELKRPYRTMTIIPVVEWVVNIVVLVLGIYQKPHKMGIGLAILFAGIPVYWFCVLWKNKPKEFTNIVDNLTIFAQKLFLLTKVKK